MSVTIPAPDLARSGLDLESLRASFQLHLRAENKSPKTIETYSDALDQLTAFVARNGMPRDIGALRREHVEGFLVSLQESGRSPATVNNRYRSLQAFFRWLVEEDELRESPMGRTRPPKVPERPVPVLREEQLVSLLATCAGRTFESRRDRAILRLLDSLAPPASWTAAHDLVAALRQLGEEGYGEVRAKTLHSYCFSLLSRSGVLTATHRVPRILMEFERDCALWDLAGPFGGILQRRSMAEAFEAAWARRQTDEPGEPVEGLDQQFQDGLRHWLRWHRGMLVGELVPEALAYLRHNPQSLELTAFDHVLVDEYQDLNRAEQDLIDLISSRGSLAIIGDDDQSIYSFKWANPDGIRTFHTHHPGTGDVMLEECRRCPTNVVELARTLAERDGARPGNHRLLPRQGNRMGEVHNVQWTSIPAEARGVARFIAARIRDGTPPGQCLVLAPRRAIGYAIRDALLGLGVEADTYFKEEPVESERAQQALTLLTLLISPEDRVSLRAWFGFGSPNRRQAPYRRALKVAQEANTDVASTVAEVAEGGRLLAYSAPLVQCYQSLNAERDALRLLVDDLSGLIDVVLPSDEPDVALLRSIALDAEAEANGNPDDFLSLVRASISQPEVPLAATRPRIMSLYKSKGLTADLVVLTGLVDGLIPQAPKPEDSEEERESLLAEQRRLFYVGLTRTANILLLSSEYELPDSFVQSNRIRRGQWRNDHYATYATPFLRELGPTLPAAIRGEDWRY